MLELVTAINFGFYVMIVEVKRHGGIYSMVSPWGDNATLEIITLEIMNGHAIWASMGVVSVEGSSPSGFEKRIAV
jgi:hypothetical protein